MKIQITDGLDKISIGVGMGSYLRINKPAAIIWPDCRGSVGQYLCQLPVSNGERTRIQDAIHSNVYQDYTDRLEELHELLRPLMQLFANGDYQLSFDNGSLKAEAQIWSGDKVTTYEPLWYVQFAALIKSDETELVIARHRKFIKELPADRYPTKIMDYTTTGFYDWQNNFYVATLPEAELDTSRIAFFKEKIQAGERPFAIIVTAMDTFNDMDANAFILDGHHKLMAYQELGIRPAVAFITRIFAPGEQPEFDLDALAGLLYPWQILHILDNGYEQRETLPQILESSTNLKKVVRHGYHEEHYANGQIKTVGNYKYHRPEGTIRECYENGRIKSERTYIDNRNTGTWKEWFSSGQLMFVQNFDDQGRLHGEMRSYFEDGEERSLRIWEHGQHGDGYSFSRYGHTRKLEYEVWQKSGVVTKQRNYNDMGGLIRTEGVDAMAGDPGRVFRTIIREEARYKLGADIYVTLVIIAMIIIGLIVLIIKILLHYFA